MIALLSERRTVEFTDGRRAHVSLLFRVKNYLHANLQIQQWHR